MYRVELMQGKVLQRAKEFSAEFGEGTAVTLRLMKPLWGSGRTIVGDSAFASVKMAGQALEHGLHFQGPVKTAHKGFPAAFFKAWATQQDGALVPWGNHKVVTSMITLTDGSTKPILAFAWRDKKAKHIISTNGTTLPGHPMPKDRHRIDMVDGIPTTVAYTKWMPRPAVLEQMHSNFSVVDIHNHYRQGVLRVEVWWSTKTWWHRIFASLFGMTVVDGYYLYLFDYKKKNHGSEEGALLFMKYCDQVAHSLIYNIWRDDLPREQRQMRTPGSPATPADYVNPEVCVNKFKIIFELFK
jgi:hypothetical protein